MLRRRPFRSSRFLFLDPRRRRLPRKRPEAHGVFVSVDEIRGVGRSGAPVGRRLFRLCCGEERRARVRDVDWRHSPGPPMRSAWERQCAGPLCLPARALSSASGGNRWGRCASRRTGSTTASAAGSRSASVSVAITATCTAPGSAPVSAGASRLSGPRGGIREAAVVRGGTPPGNAGGASGNDKNDTK